MGGIDHDAFGSRAFAGEAGDDAVEDPEPAPPDEEIVDYRTIFIEDFSSLSAFAQG
ncbi:hypothetical protein [Aestuariivirga sp.]|uniref:hypothetical protein n=1 Tax=Aestuariivirga sp. TaxID=2650926 RepID=UPI0035947B19